MYNDLRFALRSLAKTPGFTAIAVLTLAIGIGASAAVFSIVNAVVLRPLAYPASERLIAARVVLPALAATYPTLPVNAHFYDEWRACPAFQQLALLDRGNTTLTGSGEPVRLFAARSSTNLFATLRVAPALGRAFADGEDQSGKAGVAVISDRLWRERFGGAAAVLGQAITLDQRPVTIVGVLPADFRLPQASQFLSGHVMHDGEPDVYLPKVIEADEHNEATGRFNYEVIGRLAPGATLPDAVSQMDVVAARIMKLAGEELEARSFATPLQEAVTGPARRGLFVLLGAIFAVLLIACLNLSILALARAERRSHDSAVRSALGATRSRLLRQALVESLMLSLAGGTLGVLFAAWGLDVLLSFAPADLPRIDEVRLDGSVLLFALATTIASALLAGLVPAWRIAGSDAADVLRSGDSRTSTGGAAARRLREVLTGVEAGVSTVLLATAALLAGSFVRLMHAEGGFRADGALSTEVSISYAKYPSDADRDHFQQRLLDAVSATPGVISAAISNALPLQGETWIDGIWLPGDSRSMAEHAQTNVRFISADYFAALGIPLTSGRTFREDERHRKIALVSAQLAARLWPGQDPVGRKVAYGGGDGHEVEVIGIAGDVRANADQRPVPIIYLPYWEWPPSHSILVMRVRGSAAGLAPALRQAIRRVDPDVPVQPFRTMDDLLQASVAQRRFQMRLAAAFALSALTLAALGIYGVVSHSVTQRTRELGIRLAFGARPSVVCRMVVRQSLRPIALGLLGGVGAALAGGRVLASLLYETNPRDPFTLAAVALALATVALLACWLPARRATRIDPMEALRTE